METLFDKTADVDCDVFRNIVGLREAEDLFDDLSEGDTELSQVAIEAEMRVRERYQPAQPGVIYRPFHYSVAIEYPFVAERYLSTRYGDGTYGVWYGSLEFDTTIHETAFHMARIESGVEGLKETILRERTVYQVHCKAVLIDLRHKAKHFPDLVADDYFFTQSVGRRLQTEGHPGLLAPSARCAGSNAVAFRPSILSDPRPYRHLVYHFDPGQRSVRIEGGAGELLILKKFGDHRPWEYDPANR